MSRERKEPVPAHLSLDVARRVKESLCYTAADIVKVALLVCQTYACATWAAAVTFP